METAATATSNKIGINLSWEGPNAGLYNVSTINIEYEDAPTKKVVKKVILSAHSDSGVQNIPITTEEYLADLRRRRNCGNGMPLKKPSDKASLYLTIEQARSLTLKAASWEKVSTPASSQHPSAASGNLFTATRKFPQQGGMLRTARTAAQLVSKNVPLTIPVDLQIGQTYCIAVLSNGSSLSARLITQEQVQRAPAENKQAPKEDACQEQVHRSAGTYMAAADAAQKIVLNFAWTGPNRKYGGCAQGGADIGVVDLVIQGGKTMSVSLPDDINPVTPKKFKFTSLQSSLDLTIAELHNLTVKAGYFEKGKPMGPKFKDPITGKVTQQETVRRDDRAVPLGIPKDVEIGKTYTLVVASEGISLTARLVKDESSGEVSRMAEGMQNLALASSAPAIVSVHTRSLDASSDLDGLSVQDLQSRYIQARKAHRELLMQWDQAFTARNREEYGRLGKAAQEQRQLFEKLSQALEAKNVTIQWDSKNDVPIFLAI